MTPEQVQSVVDDVAEVQPFWAQLPLADRARYMRRTAQVLIDSLDELTTLLTREQGKPRNESYVMELLPTIDALHWIAKAGPEILDDEKIEQPLFIKQKRARFTYEPLGVVGVIAPWNYPWSIPFGEVAMALMRGQWRGAEAGVADPADRRADPAGLRARRYTRGPRATPCTAEAPSGRRSWSRARPRSSSPGRSRSGAAWAWPAPSA